MEVPAGSSDEHYFDFYVVVFLGGFWGEFYIKGAGALMRDLKHTLVQEHIWLIVCIFSFDWVSAIGPCL